MSTKLGNSSKQKLATLALLGAVAGLGYQIDVAQADTTATPDQQAPKTTVTSPATTTNQLQDKSATLSRSQEEPSQNKSGNVENSQLVKEAEPQPEETPAAPQAPAAPEQTTPDKVATPAKHDTPQPTNLDVVQPQQPVKRARMATPVAPIDIQTGVWGTSKWTLNDQGTMTIFAGTLGRAFNQFDSTNDNIFGAKKVVFDGTAGKIVLPANANSLFASFEKVTAYEGLDNVDTSQVAMMNNLFAENLALTSIDLSSWDFSHVSNVSYMFAGQSPAILEEMQLKSVKLGKSFNAAINLTGMFQNAANLTDVDFANWDLSHATNIQIMLSGTGFSTLDVSGWNVGHVTSTRDAFSNMANLTAINLGDWQTGKVGNAIGMFRNDPLLTQLDLTNVGGQYITNLLDGNTGLSQLVLGPNTVLTNDYGNVALPAVPVNDDYTGLWQSVETGATYTSDELVATYDGATMAGTYVWQKTTPKPVTPVDPGTPVNPGTPDVVTPGPTPETPTTDIVNGGDAATIDDSAADTVAPKKTVKTVPVQTVKTSGQAVKGTRSAVVATTMPTVVPAASKTPVSQTTQQATLPQTGEQKTSWLAVVAGALSMSLLGAHWFKRQD
ncbi:BspA family leucine-rich repeat surface protein [Levilactobacillus tongjiangensis]|uniref:BspA family leucine-rich repeat surface protein n=1 Tax=Levilactobacillus tongjiangensis TaxID=2486023 RepID=A0ABW1SRH4_9LACO|nr:BspA family leucine-rich repeat surface protein [Levilactobacillus tongjiangensis]